MKKLNRKITNAESLEAVAHTNALKEKRGITLVALVVTIVVLLILAGVSLNLVLGNNGIITKSQDAKVMSRAGSVDDEVGLWKGNNLIAKNSNGSSESENDMLQRLIDKKLITTDDEIDTTNKIIKIKKKDGTVVKEISYKDVELIKFFIDSIEYKAEKGMTWAEWCESEYNSLGVYEQYGDVFGEWGGYIATKDYSSGGHNGNYAVDPSDEIIAGFIYYCAPYAEYGWKSLTRRNGYEVPQIGDKVKTSTGWKEIIKMESYTGLEDCYDFAITTKDGKIINNYYANDTLVQGSY